MSVRISTPSRLHFGLLSLPSGPAHWPDVDGRQVVPARHFGGVGLMIERPGVHLSIEPATRWSAHGCLAQRALAYAQRFGENVADRATTFPCRIVVECCAPEHAGLGTGTQLGLAVAAALSEVWGLENMPAAELARRVGRGTRSALGIRGFEQGGFLVEGGKSPASDVAPLLVRVAFPQQWRIIVILPPGQGMHGACERTAFEHLAAEPGQRQQTEALCRLVLLGMLPALAEGDLAAFSESLYDFNRRAGELFRPVQCGRYSHPQTAQIVDYLRHQGIAGVGQSSWGPAIFAVVERESAAQLALRLASDLGVDPGAVVVSQAANGPSLVVRQ
jgi:beta-RFAP synthase